MRMIFRMNAANWRMKGWLPGEVLSRWAEAAGKSALLTIVAEIVFIP